MALTHSFNANNLSINKMSDNFPSRRNPRIKGYNYSQDGYYFLTICSTHREEIFSTIAEGKVALTEIGKIIDREWRRSSDIRKEIELDSFVIMPNHVHAIVHILETSGRFHSKGLEKKSLSSLITGFKSSVTKIVRTQGLIIVSPWHRGYYEHIIRDVAELYRIREYIASNPIRWEYDRDNLSRLIGRMSLEGA